MGTVVAASAAPYGYTLTIWSAGAVLIDYRGKPSVGDVFLFLAGAVLGFSTLGLLAQGPLANRRSIDRGRDRVIAGALDWAAVGAAVGVVALLGRIHGWVAWPLGSFVGTFVYLVGAGLQLGLVAARDETLANRSSREPRGSNSGAPADSFAPTVHYRQRLAEAGSGEGPPTPEDVSAEK